ncbi:GCN5-related N-acetyltransferase [Kribbella flavida DSM 17836]|uniref:GCN5-related N-acetyltransferase n=1 Tax=Kribbella flavida (strain DSM 17836 / JCM 10339 / NBRC 14399) TaxID=479435 RepID=D2PXB4_KRIFD|nr:GNAT family N-acetyltransferase [Kribbella flavida]ADB29762.1 GCN5-related N-acetyltransferase [Kribbella flavida DSM 17836]
MVVLERLRADHEAELLRFELENRAYFARVIPDRGDAYFAEFSQRHKALLEFQAAGSDHFHVLVDGAEIVGRVNLVEVVDGSAELGYRIAESAGGRGLATWAVQEVAQLASTAYGLTRLTAVTTVDNVASQKVLHRAGFTPTGDLQLDGRPGLSYALELAPVDNPQPRSRPTG